MALFPVETPLDASSWYPEVEACDVSHRENGNFSQCA